MEFSGAQQAWTAVFANYTLGPLWGEENMPAETRAVLVAHCPECQQAHVLKPITTDEGKAAVVCRSCHAQSPRPHYRRRKGLMRGPQASGRGDYGWVLVDAIQAAHVLSAIDRLPGVCVAWGMLAYTDTGTANQRLQWRDQLLQSLFDGLEAARLSPPNSWTKARALTQMVEMVVADSVHRKRCGRTLYSKRDLAQALLGNATLGSEFTPPRFWGRYWQAVVGLVDDLDRRALQPVAACVESMNDRPEDDAVAGCVERAWVSGGG